jgi:steroid delta-isomerase-like uncharacterized protein
MPAENDNGRLVRRFYDEVISGGDVAALHELLTADFVEHNPPPGLPPGRDGFKAFVRGLRSAFPDFQWTVDDLITSGDKVVARGHGRGTHQGEFLGVPATGRSIGWSAIHIFRVENGRLAERWWQADVAGIMEQLR